MSEWAASYKHEVAKHNKGPHGKQQYMLHKHEVLRGRGSGATAKVRRAGIGTVQATSCVITS